MRTYRSLKYEHDQSLPEGHPDEVRTPPHLVEEFLTEYTDEGDHVADIFAGYGTTLNVAEHLGREPYGIEYEPDRVSYVADRIGDSERIRQGDILETELDWLPTIDCCFTSPPFMERTDTRNPFENYAGEGSYDRYLDDIETAFRRLDSILAPGGTVVVDVSNMKHEGRVTTLAWDIGDRLSEVFRFEGEVVVTWDRESEDDDRQGAFGYGYDHSYCLVFCAADRTEG